MANLGLRAGICLLWLSMLCLTEGGYMITTPRKWVAEEKIQVCVTLDQPATPEDVVNVELKSTDGSATVLAPTTFKIVPGERNQCRNILVPPTTESSLAMILTGTLTSTSFNHTETVGVTDDVHQTYVQTDKYLYKPGQIVRFRVLSIKGPFLQLVTGQYDEIWVENPSGSRISQWLNESNANGLIHLEFQLTEEPEEGTYKIKVRTPFGTTITTDFKVEEYVLPRFEVTITPPNYVLGTTETIPFTVCAKYTFGQPVKGIVRFTIDNDGWGRYKAEANGNKTISGCESVLLEKDAMDLNGKDYFVYRLKANAEVEEDGTGVILKAKEVSVDVSRTAITFEDISVQKFLKPELPYKAEIKATFPDKSAAKDEPMKVCAGELCKTFTTDASGILTFLVPPHITQSVNIKATNYPRVKDPESYRSLMYESSLHKNFKKYHSPSNSSLILSLADKKVTCQPGVTKELTLPVKFSAVNITEAYVTVQVVSRGQLQFSHTELQSFASKPSTADQPDLLTSSSSLLLEPMKPPVTVNSVRGSFDFPITLRDTTSPEAKIVVFYIRPDGEVVSDYREVDITDCLPHSASLEWSATKAKPGDAVNLKIEALPDSLCSLGVVDKSVELLAVSSNKLTVGNLLNIAQKGAASEYENSQVNDYEYCKAKEAETTTLPPGGGIPPILPPVALPLEVAERKRRSSPPWGGHRYFNYYSDDVDAIHGFDKSGLFVFSDLTLETRPCQQGHDYHIQPLAFFGPITTPLPRPTPPRTSTTLQPQATQKPDKPINTTSDGEQSQLTEFRTYFPETWLWDIRLLSETGVSEETLELPDTVTEWVGRAVCVHPTGGVGLTGPSSVTTFRDFFADLTLPVSVKRGEILHVKVSVFNYLKDSLPIKVKVHPSPEYNILAEYDQHGVAGERFSCLSAQDKDVHEIRIVPLAFGDVNITVSAFVEINTVDACGGPRTEDRFRSDLLVKAVNVEIEGFEKEETFSKYICTQDLADGSDALEEWELTPPANIVEDSARGWLSVVGDLMGPTIENLGKLIKMPYGCGEQNMLNFAPNIFVLRYLDASNQNRKEISETAIKYMKKGYQRELNYRHDDGSYSAFGKSDASGSTWLTAFVLKSFAQARPYISIDEKDLTVSTTWLKSLQQENGCFESKGKVLHKGMKGGVDKSKSLSLLSAFVLISLLEAGEPPSSKTVKDAGFCLTAEPLTADDPYALAVRTYALALSGHEKAQEGVEALLASAVAKGAQLYWKLPEKLESGKGVGVETAAYAVLSLSLPVLYAPASNGLEARKVIKWMNAQRNGQGGFVSTQDTIIALQAMASYEESLPDGPVDVTVSVGISSTAAPEDPDFLVMKFEVNENNKLLLQQRDIPNFPARVSVDLEREGCALVQATLRYNEVDPPPSHGFDATVTTSAEFDPSCKTKRIDACASYILEDMTSNMAILEVNLISGYIPEKKDLKKIVGYGTGIIKRYEVDGSKVSFYFDELTASPTCVSFRVMLEVEVGNPKPGTISVYDYYKPELSISKSYTFPFECVREPLPLPFEGDILIGIMEEELTTLSPAEENMEGLLDALDYMV